MGRRPNVRVALFSTDTDTDRKAARVYIGFLRVQRDGWLVVYSATMWHFRRST